MAVEIISWSISTKVWYRAGIELATPGSAVRHASVARHVRFTNGISVVLLLEYIRGKIWKYYQWYTSGISLVLPVVASGLTVEINSKIWWYYQWNIGGIPVEFSGISVVLEMVSSGKPMEISGKIWWHYHWCTTGNHWHYCCFTTDIPQGSVRQSVMCLATDGSLTAYPGVASLIPARSHTCGDWSWNNFYGHSTPFRWIIQEGLWSVTRESMCTNYWLTALQACPGKSVVRWTDPSAMTIAVDLGDVK